MPSIVPVGETIGFCLHTGCLSIRGISRKILEKKILRKFI